MQNLKQEAAKLISGIISLEESKVETLLEVPPDSKLGDLAFPCFSLSKEYKKSPGEIAVELRNKLAVPKNSNLLKIEVAGPYLNFFFDWKKLAKKILDTNPEFKQKQTIAVEYISPNTNKPLTLGHLRNAAIGDCVSNLLEFTKNKVHRIILYNDRGIHICKSMLAYQKWGENKSPKKKSDHFVGDYYVLFGKKLQEEPELENEAQQMLQKWEAGDKKVLALWKKMKKWVLDGFDKTYNAFDLPSFEKEYLESKTYNEGKKIIYDGLKKGLFQKDETGAIVMDLTKEGLDKKVLIRADGTSVYITQDLYLADLKYKDFKFDKSIYVVANEQDYHFKVLFKLLKILNKPYADNCYHFSYGMVYLPSGRMKSREGTVVDADDIIAEMENIAEKEIAKRHKVSKTKLKTLAHKIGLAALKYYLLKYNASSDFVFDPEKSISFEGETGPYLQYALVRAKKILSKIKSVKSKPNFGKFGSEEIALLKKLSSFSGIVLKAADDLQPHILANYAYELAGQFNSFYEKCPVVSEKNTGLKAARLLLVKKFADVLKAALNLMGIKEVELM